MVDVIFQHIGQRLSRATYRPVSQEGENEAGVELLTSEEHHNVEGDSINVGVVRMRRGYNKKVKLCIGVGLLVLLFAVMIGVLTYVDAQKGKDEGGENESHKGPSLRPELPPPPDHRLSEGKTLAPTPPMGWNSWNKFGCEGLTYDLVKKIAQALKDTGLAEAGYKYVGLDDCWQLNRNSTGYIQPDPDRFPRGYQGMTELGDYIHNLGLKFGVYTCFGSLTCQRRPGSYGHEELDAKSYASWGVDLLKNDDCYIHPDADPFTSYMKMRVALDNTGRNIVHSIKATVPIEASANVSEMRRTGGDIWQSWGTMLYLIDKTVRDGLVKYIKPGFWNDLDMLEIGNEGLSLNESIAHFALWCAFKAPLLLGNDITQMDDETKSLLTHKGLIDINQDPLGISVQQVFSDRIHGGSAENLVVGGWCNETFDRAQWVYSDTEKTLRYTHAAESDLCLTVGPEDFSSTTDHYLSITGCSSQDPQQKWVLDDIKGTVYHFANNTGSDVRFCLTVSHYENDYVRLRQCGIRQSKYGWTPWDDTLEINKVPDPNNSEKVLVQTRRGLCVVPSALPELNIYAGPLSNRRFVAVLLNRDFSAQTMTLKWTNVNTFHPPDGTSLTQMVGEYQVSDVYLNKSLGKYTDSVTVDVGPHSAVTLVLSPVESM